MKKGIIKDIRIKDDCCIFCGLHIGHYGKIKSNFYLNNNHIGFITNDEDIILITGIINDYHWICKECSKKIVKAFEEDNNEHKRI